MKQNLYIFSNSILRKKQKTLSIEQINGVGPVHEADIDESEEYILLDPNDEKEGGKPKIIPAHNIDSIFAFGCVKFNTHFLALSAVNSIPVHVFGYYGNYIGSFLPKGEIASGNIAIAQVNAYNNHLTRLEIAKKFVRGATLNAANNLKYYQYRGADLNAEISGIDDLYSRLQLSTSAGELMGIEGSIKQLYYSAWQKVFKSSVDFSKRVRRPPDNMVNSLISFGNAVCYNTCLNEIYRTGLLPSIGYLHSPGDNRLPLSFDIAEIFKPVIVDKVIFRMVNLEMVSEDDFYRNNGMVYMKEKIKKKFIEEIENRLKTTIMHKHLKRSVTYKTLIRLECHKLIKYLKDSEEYEPFISEP